MEQEEHLPRPKLGQPEKVHHGWETGQIIDQLEPNRCLMSFDRFALNKHPLVNIVADRFP